MSGVAILAIHILCIAIFAVIFILIGKKYFGTPKCQHKYIITNMGRYETTSIGLLGDGQTSHVHKFSAICEKCGDHKVYYKWII